MKDLLKRYWKIVLVVILYGILLYAISPKDISNVGFGDKSYFYILGAKYFLTTYPAPLYITLGWVVIKLGTFLHMSDGLSMIIFLSIIPSLITIVVTYLFVEAKTKSIYAKWIAAFIVMSFWVWIMNAVRVESYNLIGMFLILGVYLSYVKKQYWVAISLFALAIACHWLNAIPTVIIFTLYNKNLLKRCYALLVGVAVYVPFLGIFSAKTGLNSSAGMNMLQSIKSYGGSVFASGNISRLPHNLENLAAIIFMGLWIAIIPLIIYWIKAPLKEKMPYIVMTFPFLICTVCSFNEASYMQWSSVVPLLAITAGIGCTYLPSIKNISFQKVFTFGMVIPILIIPFAFNHLDTNPTAARDFINSLNQVPDYSYVLAQRNSTLGQDDIISGAIITFAVTYYDREYNKHLYVVQYPELWDTRQQLVKSNATISLIESGFNFPGMQEQSFIWYGSSNDMILEAKARILEFNPNVNVYYFQMLNDATWESETIKIGSPPDLEANSNFYTYIQQLDQRTRASGIK